MNTILQYYAWANVLRGSGYKLPGYILLALPLLLADALCVVALHQTGLPLWVGFPVAAISILHVLVIFKWFWGSEYWPVGSRGQKGDPEKLEALWREKSVGAFALLVPLWLGIPMKEVGGIYIRSLTPETTSSLSRAEHLTGELYGRQQLKAIGLRALAVAGFIVWRVYG